MPKSKGRKKTKKTKKQSNNTNRDVFKSNGLEIIREGKNVIFKNNRTPEEHATFVEELKKNRPQQFEFIESEIEKVIKIFDEYDSLKLLGALSYNQVVNELNPQDDGLSEVTLELGLSFATAIPSVSVKNPSPKIVNDLISHLINIRHGYNTYMMSENVTGKYSEIESKIRFKTILEALYIRGSAYMEHVYSLYKELFSGHDEFLKTHYGFASQDILNTILQLEDSFCCRLILPNGMPHPASHARFVDWSQSKTDAEMIESGKHFIDVFGEDNLDIIVTNTKINMYSIDEIETYPDLFKINYRYPIHKLVVSAISQKLGDNHDFLNPKYKGLPLNSSTISTHPIIEINGDYYIFSFSLPTRTLFEITENLIETADKKYYKEKFLGNKYSKSRDNFLELKTAELFKIIIPEALSYLNIKYKPGQLDKNGNLVETELDLLVISEKANYLIEMKAGGLSAPAKRGALTSLMGQLKETVGYGAYQSFRALTFITENDSPEFYTDKGEIVTIDKSKDTYRITITLEHLADLVAYMYDLKELGIIERNVDFAWTCSIFDLMVFSELLEDETDFIDYLKKRVPLYQRPELDFQDELDLLGHFLEDDLNFDENLIAKLKTFRLNKYSIDIDDYFQKGGKKPVRKSRNI